MAGFLLTFSVRYHIIFALTLITDKMTFLSIVLMYGALQCTLNTVAFTRRMRITLRRGAAIDRLGITVVVLMDVVTIIVLAAISAGIYLSQ
jgi:hypothetical protein